MTCIVGIIHDSKVYMGGDSAAVDGSYLSHVKQPKVFKNGPFLIGYTTSFRMGQLLEFAELPKPNDEDTYKFMCTTFTDYVRNLMQRGGYLRREFDQESVGSFLVGINNRLFTYDWTHILENICSYASIGSGSSNALGSLYSTQYLEKDPLKRLSIALEASEQFTTSVKSPFNYISEL